MTLWHLLERAATLAPDRLAIVDGALRFNYQQFAERTLKLAAVLSNRGCSRGDRIAILAVNSHRYLEAYFAIAALGAVSVPLNHRLAPLELAQILEDAGVLGVVADREFEEVIPQAGTKLQKQFFVLREQEYENELAAASPARPEEHLAGEDLAHLYYTSGTTGRAKGVMLTHGNVTSHAKGTIEELSLSRRDVWGHIAPLFHLADAWASFAITEVAGVHVMVPRFSPEAVFSAIARQRITVTNLVPTMLNMMVKHDTVRSHDFSSLSRILSGGAPIAPDVVRLITEIFRCEYVQTYGLTETSPYLTFSILNDEHRRRSAEERFRLCARTGRPAKFVTVRVIDDKNCDVPRDDKTVGEVVASGPTVTQGYWNRLEETKAALGEGFLRTGDLAVVDADGFLQIVDRKKDMINTGGEKVFSVEVEHALYAHPAVLEAAVFALPDALWGERVAAAVVLRTGAAADSAALIAHCRERLAHFKAPREIHFLEELPKTGSGKITKRALRERFAMQPL